MKKYFLLVVTMMSFSVYAFKATESYFSIEKDSVLPDNSLAIEKVEPDEYPKMSNCQDANGTIEGFKKCLVAYFKENVQNAENLEGRVYLVFKVNADGKIEKVRIHSNQNALIEEGERLLKQMPLFVPAQKAGNPIEFTYTMPLTFKREKALKQEKYFSNPDVEAKWESCESAEDENKSLGKCIRKFMFERIATEDDGEEKSVYMLLKIDSDGNSMVEGIEGEDEALAREVYQKSREFPKFIPARKNGKLVGSINLVPIIFNKKETYDSSTPPDVYPQIKSCKDSFFTFGSFQKCLNEHVQRNFQYPELAAKYNIQRTVYVVFKIKEDKSVQILAALGDETQILRNEAIRIIKKLSVKAPAMKDGKPTFLVFIYPINFKLN
ncbi:energy transducer TonB [Capnocytophaga stomatis]|uniref:Energy transducer TonB n=1 Tax=Capnocytophaga stomatis TaxID=1848904 RepID=A0ABW8QBQ3_9FLAO|nr:energy transducer TonB [Capnocytophaga stomatis]